MSMCGNMEIRSRSTLGRNTALQTILFLDVISLVEVEVYLADR